jgi:glycosyltransferase involved in cell wall biosynthesis
MNRRVLMVTYLFPPAGGVGVQRTLKYATYLPRWGWDPVVVAPANPAYWFRDPTLLDQLPADLEVHRTASVEPAGLPISIARRLGRDRRSPSSPVAGGDGGGSSRGRGRSPLGRAYDLWNGVWDTLLFPDTAIGWVPFAVRSGRRIHGSAPLDAIYSSSPPISSHVAAGSIASRTGLPWIADFRDPWIGNAFAKPPPPGHAGLRARMERRIMARADRIVFASEGLREAYAARYPGAAGRMLAIPNGYDRADFPPPAGPTPAGMAEADGDAGGRRFRLVYTGSIYGERELEMFLSGLALLAERRPELAGRLDVEFVGWLSAHNKEVAARYLHSATVGPMLRFSGFLPHGEALARAASADSLLQLIADDPRKDQIAGAKLMEYLGQDKQILAVVPEGLARAVLRELNWGIVADPTPEGVAEGVANLLAAPLPSGRADPEGRYDRVKLARDLGHVLDEVAAERDRGMDASRDRS